MPVAADYLVRLFGLEGEVAVITGGAIGGATARAYVRAGAAVVLADKAQVTGHIMAADGGWLAW